MTQTSKRFLIVGGVAGGASAAAKLRRLDEFAEIVLFERGQNISFANCGLPYHIGGAIQERDQLIVQSSKAFQARFNVDVRTECEVLSIDQKKKTLTYRDLKTGQTHQMAYDQLILSPGAKPTEFPIPGMKSPNIVRLRTLPDMDRIIELAEGENRRAIVVGGGYIGLEVAENLRERNVNVELVEAADQVMTALDREMTTSVLQTLERHGISIHLNQTVDRFTERDGQVTAHLAGGNELHCDFVVMAVGVTPESELGRHCDLKLGQKQSIQTDAHLRTSDPDIFAVGDVIEAKHQIDQSPSAIPLAGPANRQARLAAYAACNQPIAYRGNLGTAICKCFDVTAAATGFNEKTLSQKQIAYEKVYLHPSDHATYYPGAQQIHMKVLFHPESGKLFGAQAVGKAGVDKRIDVLAVAIQAGLTVFDLEHLELTYAPPYGSAKDPVNYAGFIAGNLLRGEFRQWHAVGHAPAPDQFLLDVRTDKEFTQGTIPGAVNVPLHVLRSKLETLPQDKELLVFCRVGLRGYLACRILSQHGFKCANLSGGWMTYQQSLI